ncbi:MAG: EthD domain-containing protein [Parvularculaceae bacterium]
MTEILHYPLYKVALLMKRSTAISLAAFSREWLAAPAPSPRAGIVSFVHNYADIGDVPIENAPPAPFDAIDEFLFADRDSAMAWFGSKEFSQRFLAPRAALLGAPVAAVSGTAVEVYRQDAQPAADTVKILTFPVRKKSMSQHDFAHHWLVTHAGIALAGDGTPQRLLRLISTPADRNLLPGMETAEFDGIGIVQFLSRADFEKEFASDYYKSMLAPDEPRFTDIARSRVMLASEMRVI